MATEALRIYIDGTASKSHTAEKAVMTIHISSETSTKEEALEDVTRTSHALQALAKTLQNDSGPPTSAESAGSKHSGADVEWNMGRLTTSSIIPPHIAQRIRYESQEQGQSPFTSQQVPQLQAQQAQQTSLFGRPPQQQLLLEPLTQAEAEKYRKHSAHTDMTIKLSNRSVLSFVAAKVAVTPHAELTNINWHLRKDTREALETQVRKLAVKDAIEKANDFAEAATGSRTAKMTEIRSGDSNVSGGTGWRLFGNNAFGVSNNVSGGLFGSSTTAFGQAQTMEQEKEELNLEPSNISVTWSVQGQFVA